MTNTIDTIMIFLVLTNLMLLGSSRIATCIRVVAAQGIVLGILPLLIHHGDWSWQPILLSAAMVAIKGGVFPWLLFRALREVQVKREVEPFVGYGVSLVMGPVVLASCFWIGSKLKIPGEVLSSMVVPAAMFMILVGLFLIVSRKKALTQVLGYLVMENGIFAFGVEIAKHQPYLVELGILLDVFVAVFVMGITIFRISREFDHIDTDRLTDLRS
jgi:hydrogenase-4 component E